MKRIALEYGYAIVLVLILASLFVGKACGQDINAWDMNPHVLTNEKGDLVFQFVDPVSRDSAYVLRTTLNGVNKANTVLLKTDGVCKIGLVDIQLGESVLIYHNVPCLAFNTVSSIFKQTVQRYGGQVPEVRVKGNEKQSFEPTSRLAQTLLAR